MEIWFVLAFLAVAVLTYGPTRNYLFEALKTVQERVLSAKSHSIATPSSTSKEPVRPSGVWHPVPFSYPLIAPHPTFDIDKTLPVPFRPFKWGGYPISMGIRNMEWEEWIQVDNLYKDVMGLRKARTGTMGGKLTQTMPGYHAHALETLVELASYLSVRYPTLIVVRRRKYESAKEETWGDSVVGKEGGAVRYIQNLGTGDEFDLDGIEETEGPEWDPMRVAGLLTQDDLALMVESPTGDYVLRAGSILTAGSWRLQDKIGTTLHDIHSIGGVPGWKDKLKFSMERFFRNMKVDKPVQRNNYFFQIDDDLCWNNNHGPEEIYDEVLKGPDPLMLPLSSNPDWRPCSKVASPLDVWFRNERQTLRRMPKTGGILFTVRTYLFPVSSIVAEPGVPGRMASALRNWPKEVHLYKGSGKYVDVLIPYLEALHEKQVAEGVVEMDEDGEAVGQKKYPF